MQLTQEEIRSAKELHKAMTQQCEPDAQAAFWAEMDRIDDEMMSLVFDALIVEFRPTVWNRWLVKSYMAFSEPEDEYVSFQYFAKHFNSMRLAKEQQ